MKEVFGIGVIMIVVLFVRCLVIPNTCAVKHAYVCLRDGNHGGLLALLGVSSCPELRHTIVAPSDHLIMCA